MIVSWIISTLSLDRQVTNPCRTWFQGSAGNGCVHYMTSVNNHDSHLHFGIFFCSLQSQKGQKVSNTKQQHKTYHLSFFFKYTEIKITGHMLPYLSINLSLIHSCFFILHWNPRMKNSTEGQWKVTVVSSLFSRFFFLISKVHGNRSLSRVHHGGAVATGAAMVTDRDASTAASNAACSPSHAPTPHIDFTGDLLHDPILDHLLCAVVSLFVSIATLLVSAGGAAVEGLHGRRLGEIIVVGELHWGEGGAALLHAATGGGLSSTMVLVDAPRHGRGSPQLMVAVKLVR